MDDTNKDKILSRRFGFTAVAMIMLMTVAVIILNIANSHMLTLQDLIKPVFYIFCFMFVFLFYIDSNRNEIMKLKISGLVICLCVLSSISGFYISFLPSNLPGFVLSTVLLAGIVDMNLGLMLLCGNLLFGLLFFSPRVELMIIPLLMAALMCVLVSRLKKFGSYLVACQITIAFYIVIKLLGSDFVFDALIDIHVLYELGFYIASITIAFLIRRALVKSDYSAAVIINVDETAMKESEATGQVEDQVENTENMESDLHSISDEEYKHLQILDTEVALLKTENEKISMMLEQVMKDRCHRVEFVSDDSFEYCLQLKKDKPSLYKHSVAVANCAKNAADLIDADPQLAYAIGIYHEAGRFLGDEDIVQKLAEYHLPENLVRGVCELRDKRERPMLREAGIVTLIDDVYTAVQYARAKNRTDVTADKIISNVFRVRREQKLFTYAGISVEYQQLLKLFLTEEFCQQGGDL